MRRYHIECVRNAAGYFVGWSVQTGQPSPLCRIYPLYEMAETEALRMETETSQQEARTERRSNAADQPSLSL
ncbi:hypothetical protein BI344_17355 [Chromobacterium sphagni]|uniref:Uncharacterized protein n=1 Tax=Chromobacterium sphagni TaxID=1903179 RepID=A0ABX3CBH8_9NEIS|nr:hypothetical protein BI344_17355 [Chromobacterium sphagni]